MPMTRLSLFPKMYFFTFDLADVLFNKAQGEISFIFLSRLIVC